MDTSERKREFLAQLEKNLTLEAAAKAAGVSRVTVYRWRKADPVFNAAIQKIQKEQKELVPDVPGRPQRKPLLLDENGAQPKPDLITVRCLRDTAGGMDYYRRGQIYRVAPDSPCMQHFEQVPDELHREGCPEDFVPLGTTASRGTIRWGRCKPVPQKPATYDLLRFGL